MARNAVLILGLAVVSPLLLLFSSGRAQADQETVDPLLLQALVELDVSSEAFFTLLDTQDITQFVGGIKHAARGRILLEQYLGEDIEDVSWEAAQENQDIVHLRLIAKHAEDLSGWAAEDLWRMDYDTKNAALLRLSEMDHMVKAAKKSRGWK